MSKKFEAEALRALSLCADVVRMHGVDAWPLCATKLAQVWHDHAELWGNDGGGDDTFADPSEEDKFQVGYSFSTFVDKMGHDNHCLTAVEHLNIRAECMDAANSVAFGTFAHGNSEAFNKHAHV